MNEKQARDRLDTALDNVERYGDAWADDPYGEGKAQAARAAYEELDIALAIAGEWLLDPIPPQTRRVGA